LKPEDDATGVAAGKFTPFEPDTVTVDQLTDLGWDGYAVVVLANVPDLPVEAVTELAKYVRAGGSLMVFLGPSVRPEFYNKYFVEAGLLPGILETIRGDARYPVYLELADASHPVVRYFEEHADATHLKRPIVAFGKYFSTSGLEASGARVPFRFNDTARTPAVFDAPCGDGRVLWVASTADQEWNEFSAWPDFVVFVYESISYLVRFGMSSSNLLVGEPFRKEYPSSQYANEVLLRLPELLGQDLGRPRNVRKAMTGQQGRETFEITHDDTAMPGIYRLDLLRPGIAGADSIEYFAVNVDTAESDLRPMTEEDFRASLESLRFQTFDASERIRAVEGERELVRGREFWRWIAFAVLTLLAAETLLAFLFGRRVS
jgi:hypothetical protein